MTFMDHHPYRPQPHTHPRGRLDSLGNCPWCAVYRPADHAYVEPYTGEWAGTRSVEDAAAGRCEFTGGLYGEISCHYHRDQHPAACGVDMGDSDEPGHYVCNVPVSSRFKHCNSCHQHHGDGVSCEAIAEMMEADDELMRYAR